MPLDPDTFRAEPDGPYWRFETTPRLGQFDIAAPPSADDWGPDAAALTHLEAALARIDALYDAALIEAEKGWVARYNAPLRSRDAWSLIRLFADASAVIALSLNEGEFDTYCLWVVTFSAGQPSTVDHRIWGGAS